jgi:hypothetical protein
MDAAAVVSGPSYWQVAAALVAVLGLLVAVLRLLQRWQGRVAGNAEVRLVSVRRLGPRRELQVLRVGARIHTIYRHESAMVLLASEDAADHADGGAEGEASATAPGLARRVRALVAAAGGGSRPASP